MLAGSLVDWFLTSERDTNLEDQVVVQGDVQSLHSLRRPHLRQEGGGDPHLHWFLHLSRSDFHLFDHPGHQHLDPQRPLSTHCLLLSILYLLLLILLLLLHLDLVTVAVLVTVLDTVLDLVDVLLLDLLLLLLHLLLGTIRPSPPALGRFLSRGGLPPA